jgi:hypothetical protein
MKSYVFMMSIFKITNCAQFGAIQIKMSFLDIPNGCFLTPNL